MSSSSKSPTQILKNIGSLNVNEILPIALDSVISYINESGRNANPEQIEVALLAGITAFLSTLNNDGHYDQAYKAALTSSKSISHAVNTANVIGDKFPSPHRKTLVTLDVASNLIKNAALTSLTGFPESKKINIGKDISGIVNLFTLMIPRPAKTKGKGLFGAGIGDFENNWNTEWLNPNEDEKLVGGDWKDVVGKALNFVFRNPYEFPGYRSNTVSIPSTDTTFGTSTIFDNPNFKGYDDKCYGNFTSFDTNSSSLFETPPPTPTPVPTPAGESGSFWKSLGRFGLSVGSALLKPVTTPAGLIKAGVKGIAGAVMGSPMLQTLALTAAAYAAPTVWNIVKKTTGMIGDATYGTFRRWIKRNAWSDTNRTPWYSKIGHKVARGLKNIYTWNDKQINAAQQWGKKYGLGEDIEKLGATVAQLAPAMGQDYIEYNQRMNAYQQQQDKAKAEHDFAEQTREEQIRKENEDLIAKNKQERAEAMQYNAEQLEQEARNMQFYEDMVDYNKRQDEADRKLQKDLTDFEYKMAEIDRSNRSREAKRAARAQLISTAKNAVGDAVDIYEKYGNPVTSLTSEVLNAVGADGKSFVQIQQAGMDKYGEAQKWANRAMKYAESANNATTPEAKADFEKKMDDAQSKFSKTYKEAMTLSNNARKERASLLGKISDGVFGAVEGVTKTIEGYSDARRIAKEEIVLKPKREIVGRAPTKKPDVLRLKAVPEEITPESGVLKKFVKKEYVQAPLPEDIYNMRHTQEASAYLPYYLEAITEKHHPAVEPEEPLPYVSPMTVEHVNPSSGSSKKLRTQTVNVYKSPGLVHASPMTGNTYSYYQPQKRSRVF